MAPSSLGAPSRTLRDEHDLDPLLDRVGDARIVMLGEASHGTSEYYRWRARISQRLIEERGFDFIAVEGDFPDCQRIDRYVRHLPDAPGAAEEALMGFHRWPTWMWANREVQELAEGMRGHNEGHPQDKAGFHGFDVYSLWDSMRAVLAYLERIGEDGTEAARAAMRCFDPYHEDEQRYAAATRWVPQSCEQEVVDMLVDVRKRIAQQDGGGHDAFEAEQNALVARNAERYYRAMVRGGAESWNARDEHMMDTLDRILDWYGPESKGIVWAHNTHVGDARFTDMAGDGMHNVGQLGRERHGEEQCVLVGFGSYRGSVIAGRAWDAPMERMPVPEARAQSLEDLLHRERAEDRMLTFEPDRTYEEPLDTWLPHRAIGVVYHPERERWGNYVPTLTPRRYDAFLYLDRTQALDPLHPVVERGVEEETFPWGV